MEVGLARVPGFDYFCLHQEVPRQQIQSTSQAAKPPEKNKKNSVSGFVFGVFFLVVAFYVAASDSEE